MRSFVLAFLASAALSGCTIAASNDVKTSGIEADYAVATLEANATTVSVQASFRIGATVLDLTGNDGVYCDGVQLTREKTVVGTIAYLGTLPRKAAGQSYMFELRRADETLRSTVAQPEPVTIAAPTSGATLRVSAANEITWGGPNKGNVRLSVYEDNCLKSNGFDGDGRTSYTIASAGLAFLEGKSSCPNAFISIRRTELGTGATQFKRVSIEASVTDRRPVKVVP